MKPSFTKSWTVILALLALTFSAVGVTPAHAATFTVTNLNDSGAGSLRQAVMDANAAAGADTIIFASSLGTDTITLAAMLPIITDDAGLTIDGDNRIALSGNDNVQVLSVSAGALLTLQNISVTHGNATSGGGGLYNEGTVTIIHSAFSNNSATGSRGGGVANVGGTATITNSAFSNNSATADGGGVFNDGTLTIANSAFSNNSATAGGGVLNNNGIATILNSTFSGNSATNNGGGVTNSAGTLTIANSAFSNNSANFGGGVINNSGTATILNSTFSGNSATAVGGGVATYKGDTVPTTTIRNTILANSAAGEDCWNHATGTLSGGNNIIETATTCNSIATITSDPNLGSLTGSPAYFPLNAGSPAIDAGDDAVCAAVPVSNTSQNGLTRPQGMHCDIGSVEALRFLVYLPLVMR